MKLGPLPFLFAIFISIGVSAGNGGSRDGGFYAGILGHLGVALMHEIDPELDYGVPNNGAQCRNLYPRRSDASSIYQTPPAYKREFLRKAEQGLEALKQAASAGSLEGDSLQSTRLTPEQLARAEEKLREIAQGDVPFILDLNLRDPVGGQQLTAQNWSGRQVLKLNPKSWEAIRLIFLPEIADELMQAIAVHEIFGLLKIEKSNFYPFSSQIAARLRRSLSSSTAENLFREEFQERISWEQGILFVKFSSENQNTGLFEKPLVEQIAALRSYYRSCGKPVMDWDLLAPFLAKSCQTRLDNECVRRGFGVAQFNYKQAERFMGLEEETLRSSSAIANFYGEESLSFARERMDWLQAQTGTFLALKKARYQLMGQFGMEKCRYENFDFSSDKTEIRCASPRGSLSAEIQIQEQAGELNPRLLRLTQSNR